MKTIHLILIATMLMMTSAGMTQSESKINPVSAQMPLSVAMHNPDLVKVMRIQLKPDFLFVNEGNNEIYTVQVLMNHTVFSIFGTHAEWLAFFNIKEFSSNKKDFRSVIHKNIKPNGW